MYQSKFNSFVRNEPEVMAAAPKLLGHTTRASDMREPSRTGTWKVVITIAQGDGQQTDFTYVQANTSGYFASTNALRQFRNTTDSFVHTQITDVVATYQYA
jgi:hypothetical protein